jgi:hypothetical protein
MKARRAFLIACLVSATTELAMADELMIGDGHPDWLPPVEKPEVLQIAIAWGFSFAEGISTEFSTNGRRRVCELIRECMLSRLRERKNDLGLSGYPAAEYLTLLNRIASVTSTAGAKYRVMKREIRRHDYYKHSPNQGRFGDYVLGEISHADLWAAARDEIEKIAHEGAVKTDRLATVVQETINGLSVELLGGVQYNPPFGGNGKQKAISWPSPQPLPTETESVRISTDVLCSGYVPFAVNPCGDILAVRGQGKVQLWRLDEDRPVLDEAIPIDGQCRYPVGLAINEEFVAAGDLCAQDACPSDPKCQSGAINIFRREDGHFVPDARLTSPDAWKDLMFGSPIAMDRDRILVGSSYFSYEQHKRPGAIQAFRREGNKWKFEGTLSGTTADLDFGASPVLQGTTAVIGAPTFDPQGRHSYMQPPGRVRIYYFEHGKWVDGPNLTAFDGLGHDRFGSALSLDGTTLAVGAPTDSTSCSGAGSVYMFEREKDRWVLQDKITPPDIRVGQAFGQTLLLQGNSLYVVAQPSWDAGGVYEFEKSDGVWRFVRWLSTSDSSLRYVGAGLRATEHWLIVGAGRPSGPYSHMGELLLYPLRSTNSSD